MSNSQKQILKICNGCGEVYDLSIEVEAIHHNQPDHPPLLPPRTQWRRPAQATILARAR